MPVEVKVRPATLVDGLAQSRRQIAGGDLHAPQHRPHGLQRRVQGVSVADINGDGHLDIVFSSNVDGAKKQLASYIYFGAKAGFSSSNREELPTMAAGGNLVADLNGDGLLDVTFANHEDGKSQWQVYSYVYWGSTQGLSASKRTGLLTVGATGVLPGMDPGAVHGRGSKQTFTSRALDTGLTQPVFLDLSWKGTTPKGTTVSIQLRSAASLTGLQSAAWSGPTSASGSYPSASTAVNPKHQGHRHVQYRAILGNDFGNTPVLDSVSVRYH